MNWRALIARERTLPSVVCHYERLSFYIIGDCANSGRFVAVTAPNSIACKSVIDAAPKCETRQRGATGSANGRAAQGVAKVPRLRQNGWRVFREWCAAVEGYRER
jgi:hypothetical protein